MLHAVNNKKARLQAFRSAGLRVPLEDVVTSSVFGPLEYMSPSDRDCAVEHVFEVLGLAMPARRGHVGLQFWPRFPILDGDLRARYSEPDFIVVDDEGPIAVVEVKWGAPLSEFELAAQWVGLGATGRERALHLVIVQEPASYRAAIEDDRRLLKRRALNHWPVTLHSWRQMVGLSVTAARSGTSVPVRSWAAAVAAFIRREHRFALHGWDNVGLRRVRPFDWHFRRPWFASGHAISRHEGWWTDDRA